MTFNLGKRTKRLLLALLGVYLLLLISSHIYQLFQKEAPTAPDKKIVYLQSTNPGEQIKLAYKDIQPESPGNKPPLILIHGSPGDAEAFDNLIKTMPHDRRIIAPDLPGFGDSSEDIPDYSFRAHAIYIKELLDEQGIEKADFLGFSMGGGVVLSLYEIAPERVRSVTMNSAIGVQEYELLGDYGINHSIHGLQLVFFQLLKFFVPHFGVIGQTAISYCRNFYDSDQRPLRETLQKIDIPFLIIHGKDDPLVPVAAAREHYRLVPQSEYHELDDDHFFIFMRPEKAVLILQDFFEKVDTGKAITRTNAAPARIESARQEFKPQMIEADGATSFVIFLLLAVATLGSEDLTCIAAGVLAAQGRISFTLAVAGSFFGIVAGDILLFLAGRLLGRGAVKLIPFRWFINDASIEKASVWFRKRGVWAIFISRFTPGLRLPVYFSAGVLQTSFWKFSLLFLLAATVWTPILVGLSAWLGGELIRTSLFIQNFWLGLIIFAISLHLLIRFILRVSTWRGRRLLLGSWRRFRYWEFWRWQIFYLPVFAYIGWLAIKFRGLATFTATNPAIHAGGFVGESKNEILNGLASSGKHEEYFLHWQLLPGDLPQDEKLNQAKAFLKDKGLDFPVAVKPDAGQRGAGVSIAKDETELASLLEEIQKDIVLQEFAEGDEFSVFYYRLPDEDAGKIFSMTEKKFPVVVGNGKSTLEELILKDERAICMAKSYFARNEKMLESIPQEGETVQLIDIGTHSRGAIFNDGIYANSPELEAKIDAICKSYEGFYFGRFDIRTASTVDFKRGENFKIIELNGVTSESTDIYDRKNSLLDAYRILFRQWHIAFEIGAQNRERGIKPTPIAKLAKLLWNEEY